MKRKYVFTLISILLLFIVFQLLTLQNLELKTQTLIDFYVYFSFALYGIVFYCLYKSIPKNIFKELVKAFGILALFATVTFLFIYSSSPTFFSNIKDDGRILFVNKLDSEKVIMRRLYWTGITSCNENYDTVVTRRLFKNIRWTKQADINKIDLSEWIVIQEK